MTPADNMGHAYATLIRHELQQSRAIGLDFDTAWGYALSVVTAPGDPKARYDARNWSGEAMDFLRRHMEAAYGRRQLGKPFTLTADGDALGALPGVPDATLRGGERNGILSATRADDRGSGGSALAPSERRCKSGDGCDRIGGHGRWGAFCEYHADEMARIGRLADEHIVSTYAVTREKALRARKRGNAASAKARERAA